MSKGSRINVNFADLWSGRWESNPRPKLGKLLYCHCTTPALCYPTFYYELTIHRIARCSSNFLGASQAITSGLPVVHEEWLTDLNEPAR